MSKYTLGLDLGTTSIGWAIIDLDVDDDGEILAETGIRAAGVRIFPEGVDRDTRGAEKPKNAQRRTHRGMRRNRYRRHQRRRNLVRTLVEAGLLPADEKERHSLWSLDPYRLRARGLDEALTPYEFGRALFHLNQRRGFQSNRKTGSASEDKGILSQMNELSEEIEQSDCRTLGEYFDLIAGEGREQLTTGELRLRKRPTRRTMYKKEFELLWNRQSRAHPEILTDTLRQHLYDNILYFQRPLKSQAHLIGECDLEEGEKRC